MMPITEPVSQKTSETTAMTTMTFSIISNSLRLCSSVIAKQSRHTTHMRSMVRSISLEYAPYMY